MENKETLEEAMDRLYNYPGQAGIENKHSFMHGAFWQAERMYSQEEVNEIIAEAWLSCEDNEGDETFTNARERILTQMLKEILHQLAIAAMTQKKYMDGLKEETYEDIHSMLRAKQLIEGIIEIETKKQLLLDLGTKA